MSERGAVRFGESTIEYEVVRRERRKKTVQITVDGSGVQVAAPMSTPEDELERIVRKRAAWILRQGSAETLTAAPKRFVSGETLPYLGRNVRMLVKHADVRKASVRFDHWRFRFTIPHGWSDDERRAGARRAVEGWYRKRAAVRLQMSVGRWWPRLGTGERPQVLIRDQRQRWGQLRAGRDAAVQLADDDAGAGAGRIHRGSRTGAPVDQAPHAGLLGAGGAGDAGRAATTAAAARGGAAFAAVRTGSQDGLKTGPSRTVGGGS